MSVQCSHYRGSPRSELGTVHCCPGDIQLAASRYCPIQAIAIGLVCICYMGFNTDVLLSTESTLLSFRAFREEKS